MIEPLPGAAPHPAALQASLERAIERLGPGYRPRTRHLAGDGRPRFTNRLALESSPYLLQHAHNPVAWWPWGDEAFEEARRTGRPIFLSIGYSTCHWCHVMERESFEDEEVARYLNQRYVAIKVDREERPDVDAIYMTAVQALTGGGGWPMTVFLDADREPFFAGTYFPARDGDRGPARGLLSILAEIVAVWERDPPRVKNAGRALAEAIRVALSGAGAAPGDAPPGAEPIQRAVRFFEGVFDAQHGGVNRAPKFPSNLPVRLLLRHHRRTHDPSSLHMALLTLERMAAGGLMDQVGGGFHRYSTDERWLVPHFEKMLYDNAQLAVAYAEAWQVTGRRDLARVARQTLDYVLRELASPEGALWSATDADSEGEEGRFYVWEERELREVLGAGADRFLAFYGVTPGGNFEGRNILAVPSPDEDAWEALAPARVALYQARARRPPPLLDDKVVAAWNGLGLSALAFGGRVLDEPLYVEAAARAARFVLGTLRPAGRLARSWRAGALGPPGYLSDHAFLVQGLLDLHEATLDPTWLREALALASATEELFADPRGGWFVTGHDQEELLAREKPTHDGAEPSGAAVALLNAVRLEAYTADARWSEVVQRALRWYAPALAEQPVALTELLLGLDAALDGPGEVVLVWPEDAEAPAAMLEVLRRTFMPARALTGAAEGATLARLAAAAPVAAGRAAVSGQPTAYVCERGACRLPAVTPEKLADQLRPVRPYRG
ncbi:thioredoxin domain-containing protein [Anaeromyxobacter diazotrophicus]|uniref:Thioredoxin n=1 Tax=Anaeromyxobacter diazotrophicus TaxID=2590199 RepID=A0A7I9VJ93_9BACT|nr:thioredoxin domain-containing protein [Anaeromyxobacter diazotrophicus]GEJ56097.1 thioredoxin [Anaeromyxobacter diazotrophicus]